MKLLILSALLLSSLTSQAASANLQDARDLKEIREQQAERELDCSQNDLKTIFAVYDSYVKNSEQVTKIIFEDLLAQKACNLAFEKVEQNLNDTTDAVCDNTNLIKDDATKSRLSDQNRSYSYIKAYSSKESFVRAHTTSLSMTCETAHKNVMALKYLLKL